VLHQYLLDLGVTTFGTVDDLIAELRRIAAEMRTKEINLRLRRRIKPLMVRLGGATVDELKADHADQILAVEGMLPNDPELQRIVDDVTRIVDTLIDEGRELNQFRGKKILRAFYQRHVGGTNTGYNTMCIEVAKRVAKDPRVYEALDPIFERLLAD
jgi:hypothetical protein